MRIAHICDCNHERGVHLSSGFGKEAHCLVSTCQCRAYHEARTEEWTT